MAGSNANAKSVPVATSKRAAPRAKTPRPSGSKPRAPGRPRNARIDQRERLLATALSLFSKRGIAATPLSAVARAARVTPALVHYYFAPEGRALDSRERLLDAIVAERIAPLVMAFVPKLAASAHDPRLLLRAFVAHVADTMSANPWFPPLWVREVLSDGGLLRERILGNLAGVMAPRVREHIANVQAAGLINPDLDPRLLVVSLVGLAVFPFAARPIWSRVFDAADISPGDIVRHTTVLLERGLEFVDVESK